MLHQRRPLQGQLPHGDILLHAGDFSNTGTLAEVQAFLHWLQQQPHRLKIVIAGNHDVTLDAAFYDRQWSFHHTREDAAAAQALLTNPALATTSRNNNSSSSVPDFYTSSSSSSSSSRSYSSGIVYLDNSGCVDAVTGLRFWGSPQTPEFCGWAFATADAAAAAQVWSRIPADTDILLTHGPPAGVLDTNGSGSSCGCPQLSQALECVHPTLHVFGHIHESYGTAQLSTGTLAVNASTCDVRYRAIQPPLVVQMRLPGRPTAAAAAAGAAAGRQKPAVVGASRSWRLQ
uniref:Calcineurin-like phosphoesterase domain-containing protein n=1 Tax=Tetradesmus obliquus TaxID=3088 RepID=A0A383WAH8_TETOB|eukprot:jgi/Sobl393_1/16888/SZX74109.1